MKRRAAALAALALVLAASCAPVVGTPIPAGPVNECGPGKPACSVYATSQAGVTTSVPTCVTIATRDVCTAGLPTFPFTLVVNVPDSSFYAPGRVFALSNNDVLSPSSVVPNRRCTPPSCVQLPELVSAQGKYLVTHEASVAVGYPLPTGFSVPVRVTFVPFGPDAQEEARALGLPLTGVQTSSRMIAPTRDATPEVTYAEAVSVGSYLRIAAPEPPYDAYFPPVYSAIAVREPIIDNFTIGTAAEADPEAHPGAAPGSLPRPLDDETGQTRTTTITRRDGLDGFQVWIAQHANGRRISTLKTLSGTTSTAVLHTIGFRQQDVPALTEGVDVVISPPASWIGVPRLESAIINGGGFGFANLEFPVLPAPITFNGVVAQGDGALIGVPSRVAFTSTAVLKTSSTTATPTLDTTLKYAAVVSTDDIGRFTTVLPPGTYDVVIEPLEGTGRAKTRDTVDTTQILAKTFRPPARTIAVGRARLADGRPLSEAVVRALPTAPTTSSQAVTPRPAMTRTDAEGVFRFELDPGAYDLQVEPQEGTSFPRIVQARSFSGAQVDVGDVVVPAPARIAFFIRDPSDVGNPIIRAVVQVFAELPGRGPPAVEIAQAVTDTNGSIEILLDPQAR
ncbi:MAG: hypothetical protein JWP97_5983 [Labilithrix sp.]|nr:hypothetical protein [Labilithrix sp.]